MSVDKINPRHPVLQFMEGQWPKVVALWMHSEGLTEKVIPVEAIIRAQADPKGLNLAIRLDDPRGIVLYLLDHEQTRKKANEEGGLPVDLN